MAVGTPPASALPGLAPSAAPASLGLALVYVLLAFGGWSEIATLSAEVKDARFGMARAHVYSILLITALYMLVNWAFLRGLGFEGLATSPAPAAELMRRAFGADAALTLAIAVACAAVTSINATIIVGARTTFAAARDFPGLGKIGHWDEQRGIPARATWTLGLMSLALVGLGAYTRNGFQTIVDYTFPALWLFLSMSAGALVILRWKYPDAERPFKTPLYPLTPIVFAASCLYMLWSSLSYIAHLPNPRLGASVGIAVLALGLVALVLTERATKSPANR